MTLRRVAVSVVLAGTLGLVVAAPFGDDRQVSVQLWLSVAAAWLVTAVVRGLLGTTPYGVRRGAEITWPWRRAAWVPDHRPRQLRTLDVIVRTATASERGNAGRLRPHLERIAGHYLPQRHAVAGTPDSEAVALGDVAWLIDPDERRRTPTIAEIDEFLDRVLPEDT